MFSILIPTWNNLAYLKLCVQSIRAHSAYDHQIIVHVNDGSDGSLEWAREQGLDITHSSENIGICLAVNESAMLAQHDYIVFLNDDMVCCPGWDAALARRLEWLDTDLFMLSGTMIEPVDTGNPCVVVGDYGRDADTFDEARLLADAPGRARGDWYGATWPPTVVHRRWWFKLGGYSSELTPGMSSDNDFSMKLWRAGCRIFLGVGDSLAYHFQCKSTGKVKKNDGRRQFLNKWGLSQSTFDKHFLRRGTPANAGWRLPEPARTLKLRGDLWRNDLSRRLCPGIDVL